MQVNSVPDLSSSNININGQQVDLAWQLDENHSIPRLVAVQYPTTQAFAVLDQLGLLHELNISFSGTAILESDSSLSSQADDGTQNITFEITSVDGVDITIFGFVLVISPLSENRILHIIPFLDPEPIDSAQMSGSFANSSSELDDPEDRLLDHNDDDFNIGAEIESLLLLEAEAKRVQSRIASKKHAISGYFKHHRDQTSLRNLVQQCDGILCAARVVAQRICDKVGISTEPSFSYAQVNNKQTQTPLSFGDECNEKAQHNSTNCMKNHSTLKQAASQPLFMTKHESASGYKPFDSDKPFETLIHVLEIIAGALGLAALYAFIRRKCMSARKRVERDADQEERRNARAYRRAARRAALRARWAAFVKTINCFRPQPEPRIGSYEEKRALILQDALLEQDLDSAEKGEIMEAEIRELRYAHEIVSSLVRVGEHRYDLITPINDPPPPLVPLPFTPVSRSRASTGTLPSYSSESLPGYASRAATDISRSNSIVGDLPHATLSSASSEAGYPPHYYSTPSESGNSLHSSRFTPESSVIETSRRPSQDTLQTRQSTRTGDS